MTLAKSPPDGDTLGVGATGALLINPNLPGSTAPDLLRELTPVAKLIEVGVVVVANPKTGPKSILDLIERSKTSPQGLSYGSTGVHTGQHLPWRCSRAATGANLVHIPYRGSAPAIVDLVAGQIPLAAVDITSAYPHIVGGPRDRARHGRDQSGPRPRPKSRPSPKAACRASGARVASSDCSLREARRRLS